VEYDRHCQRCPRLARYLDAVREAHPDYHAAPVAAFGAVRARLLIVGLAPGPRGANRLGRPFTGDASARVLIPALHQAGFANQACSERPGDGLRLIGCRITNAVKCLPPGNRPTGMEVRACGSYLAAELQGLMRGAVRRNRCVLALGRIAHDAVLGALGVTRSRHPFAHGAAHTLRPGLVLVDCYHPSQQNVNTGRLTPPMLDAVLADTSRWLAGPILDGPGARH